MRGDAGRMDTFCRIPLPPPREAVLRRLGVGREGGELRPAERARFDRFLEEGMDLCRPAGAYRILPFDRPDGETVRLADGGTLRSAALGRMLQDCAEAVLLGATVGLAVVEAAAEAVERGEAFRASVLDAVGAEAADAVLDWLLRRLDAGVSRAGRRPTRCRFSPGYGDLPLEAQRILYERLPLSAWGVRLSPRLQLVPEKSVLAVAGLRAAERAVPDEAASHNRQP